MSPGNWKARICLWPSAVILYRQAKPSKSTHECVGRSPSHTMSSRAGMSCVSTIRLDRICLSLSESGPKLRSLRIRMESTNLPSPSRWGQALRTPAMEAIDFIIDLCDVAPAVVGIKTSAQDQGSQCTGQRRRRVRAQFSAGIRKTVRKQLVRQRPASESPAATSARAGLLVTSDVVQRVTPDSIYEGKPRSACLILRYVRLA